MKANPTPLRRVGGAAAAPASRPPLPALKLRCRLYQLASGVFTDDRGEAPAWWRRHRAACPVCAQWHASISDVARRLTATGPACKQPVPPYLHGRVLAAVRGATRAPSVPRWGVGALAGGVALAGVVLAAVLLLVDWSGGSRRDQLARPAVAVPGSDALAAIRLELPTQQRLFELAGALDEPLETELQSVVNDAKRVALVLAQNFLPTSR